jgi:hypothetical protein
VKFTVDIFTGMGPLLVWALGLCTYRTPLEPALARPCLVFACTRRTDPARRRRNSFLPAAWRGAYALGCLSLSPPSAMDPQRAQCGRVAASADLASSRRKECYAGRRGGCAAGQGHSRRRVESQERASGEGRVPRRMRSA